MRAAHGILVAALLASGAAGLQVVWSPNVLLHRCAIEHPECPERVSGVREHLLAAKPALQWQELGEDSEALATTLRVAEEVHWDEYLAEVRGRCARGGGQLDADTYLNADSWRAITAGTASWVQAVRHTLERKEPAFALSRPPGHHATRSQGMGFCVLNHCAIAARVALEAGCERVAIFDFDVHHGNGIESLFRQEERVRYCSIHQGDFFPFTGNRDDRGLLKNLLNVPVAMGSDWQVYRDKLDGEIIPWLQEFDPQLLIVSAGYDALDEDPLAGISLQPQDFAEITKRLVAAFGKERIAMGLEGGYNVAELSKAVELTLAELE